MLLDPQLDTVIMPVDQYCHDWMHAFFIRGVFNITTFLFLVACKNDGVSDIYAKLHEYVGLWSLPRGGISGRNLANVFLKSRETANTKAKSFKCQASEALSLLPIMYVYVMKVIFPRGFAREACEAFVRMCDLIWCILAGVSGHASPATLRERTNDFLDACEAAGWQDYMTPKYHWLIHFPKHLQKFQTLLSCFVHERKHKMAKRFLNDVLQLEATEKSVLSEVTCLHLANLHSTDAFDFTPHLMKPARAAPKKMHRFLEERLGATLDQESVTTAMAARCSSLTVCHSRDIVLFAVPGGNKAVGEIWFHASVSGTMVSLVSVWTVTCYDRTMGVLSLVETDDDVQLLHTTDIITAMVQGFCKPPNSQSACPMYENG